MPHQRKGNRDVVCYTIMMNGERRADMCTNLPMCGCHGFSGSTPSRMLSKRSCDMSEPSYHPSIQGPRPTYTIALHAVRTGPSPEGQLGEGVWLQTDRGTIHAILHPSPEGRYGV